MSIRIVTRHLIETFYLKGKNTGVIIHNYINKCTNRMLIDTVLISRITHCK